MWNNFSQKSERKLIKTLKNEFQNLGNTTSYEYQYNPKLLEIFENSHPNNDYWVTLNADEFSSLCPITNQPDFGTLIINYIPNIKMVESKSLKLYLFSFINNGEFHEEVVNKIGKDLVELMQPKYLEVIGLFYPRGNISIHPSFFYANSEEKYQQIKEHRFMNHNLNPQRKG